MSRQRGRVVERRVRCSWCRVRSRRARCRSSADLDDPSLYFNQELSWLDFNWRVLWLALDERTPLLERVRFAAITASNLDEFYPETRGRLETPEGRGGAQADARWTHPRGAAELIREAAGVMHRTMTTTWEQQLKPALADKANVVICELRRSEHRAALHAARVLPDPFLPHSDAADGRSGPPLSLHLQPEPVAGRAAAPSPVEDTAFCPHQGADEPRPLAAAAGHAGRRQPLLPAGRAVDHPQHQRAVPGHGRAQRPSLPHHPQRRRAPGRGRGRGLAGVDLRRAAGAALRRRGAPGSRQGHAGLRAQPADARAGVDARPGGRRSMACWT